MISAVGTADTTLIERWPILDRSIYGHTVITLTTVGFGETHELSRGAGIFTIALILSSMGILGYSISTIASSIMKAS